MQAGPNGQRDARWPTAYWTNCPFDIATPGVSRRLFGLQTHGLQSILNLSGVLEINLESDRWCAAQEIKTRHGTSCLPRVGRTDINHIQQRPSSSGP
ncbi:uncharacterized protein ColSpa_02688 [Colletotrichum spaethianum]|uniref:Uncharacterized protein n=1 Tax=Colletotrichum spaethianum TaxID=700344 RepID=A0AA37LE12_9PEZI|nr:uncharacterized protein ColSpa_02688 [Colletotrichum spaethianum]GKT42507.1 hypothetical protein ColSpa_02688 [Colletotrichum spaethianum]